MVRTSQLRPFEFSFDEELQKEMVAEEGEQSGRYQEIFKQAMKADGKVEALNFPQKSFFDRLDIQSQNKLLDLKTWELTKCIKHMEHSD